MDRHYLRPVPLGAALLAGVIFTLAVPARAEAAGPPAAAPVPESPPTIGASYVSAQDGRGRFPLSSGGHSAPLYVDGGDWPGVVRALQDLQADIGHVTGAQPTLSIDSVHSSGSGPRGGAVVLVGTLGRSPVIDRLVREKKLNVDGIAGRWETFVVQPVERPLPGVDRALVIAGSDKRGTIYGIYDLSEQIGVSPWAWWADVPVRHRDALFVLPGRHSDGTPAVKYRGIFLNDEAPALSGWVNQTFGGFNHRFYEHVFELILRLKGNYLWPAMWGNAFNDDDKLNPKLADEYGIVMGTSHHEPMLRAQQEWKRYGSGPWDYTTNDSTLRAFWRQGIVNMDSHESIVTVGMRGDGDKPMTQGTAISLLERIVRDQRQIIADVTGKPASATPQLWALYKEVQDYYDQGMRVPDDVTLLFSDDNWGNIRRLPQLGAKPRSGGYGIYYHFDYVGGPRNYKWINTNPIARVWEQMHLAHEYGADRIWIVNVGDLKPMEFPISFFLDYAWSPDAWPAEKLPEYTREWAAQQFGRAYADSIADILTAYTKYNGRRKPELLDTLTYSLTSYREAERVTAAYDSLAAKARRIEAALPAEYHDAYYQLVLYPVEASANLNELYVTAAKNHLYARQMRAATNRMADSVRALFERDARLSHTYNEVMAGGKWDHMMDQTHIGYTYWQEPPRNVMPRVTVIQVPEPAEMGVAIQGSERAWPGFFPGGRNAEPTLPAFDPYQKQSYYVEVFNRGRAPFDFTAKAAEPWVTVSPAQGRVDEQQRLWVSVDWAKAPTGTHQVPITITGAGGRPVVVQAVVDNPATPTPAQVRGFVEGDGYVSMEAAHHSRAVGAGPVHWQTIPDLGRTLSGVEALPVTTPAQTPGGKSPHLEYRMYLFKGGDVDVSAYVSPTLNFNARPQGLRYAVSFDDQPPKIVNILADSSNRAWEKDVSDAVNLTTTRLHVDGPGEHVLNFWLVDPGVVLQKLVVDAGGVKPTYLGPPESWRNPTAGGR
ncbi:MAG TPA: glycosyl hydrolase 115 family protein [Longimicrobiaceae bacterium]|nr:glycosyl hydrolase 115 family protein [Longimicrobiaceae bacterium]